MGYVLQFSEVDTVEVLGLIKKLLVFNRSLRAFIVPPLHRLHPSGFKEDVASCLVSFCGCSKAYPFLHLHLFLDLFDQVL